MSGLAPGAKIVTMPFPLSRLQGIPQGIRRLDDDLGDFTVFYIFVLTCSIINLE